ncbi:cytochrome P450 [Colletotrichum higginsianum]|uniref:Cytochrome P450 n=2 Tax=Colletotrichum higginsianum TaxID=80884 RepID=H1VYT6_COLHI|nr:Cytochrome P450 [Colletotrichum higginsianum IMI 349063]OBR07573.1 Cytochrome P450 [Colletotrichum higginsianum IMI 349063]TIC92548.1 Cytochrome P450 3A2 [Colletotrichum higginsianum]CCF45398.1 cytochrome P450 [Colletotrichum higginsianum]
MVSSIFVLVGAVIAYGVYSYVAGLQRNIAEAKKVGLPYVVTPASPFSIVWQLTHKFWIPIIKILPKSWWENWLEILIPNWSYNLLHKPFARIGETFMVVSPFQILILTDSAEAIHQITQQRDKFPKLVETYAILKQFGDNVLTTEGVVWRMHRKVTSATFNEKNAALVFAESIKQAQSMTQKWLGPDGRSRQTVETLDHDTMRLALNIISYVGFGMRLLWPGQALPEGTDPKLVKYSSLEAPPGHIMSFVDAIAEMLEHILVLLLVPHKILKMLPFKYTKKAIDSHDSYVQYIDELMQDKIEDLQNGDRGDAGMDLMGQLVRSKYGDVAAHGGINGVLSKSKVPQLSKSEISGNTFIMLVAGHETTANAMHFGLIEIACNPAVQRQLQKDIDGIFGDSDPSTWNYESTVNPMLASMLGACMNETLRMTPAVVEIPKKVNPEGDGIISLDGEKYVLPKGAHISLVGVAAHRNPRNWPSKPSRVTSAEHDLDDYAPERWYRASPNETATEDKSGGDTEDYGGYKGSDTSDKMFRPVRGSYVPFSDGPRSCLGRRIAQVEIIAALSVVFQRYSLELAVDEWASDADVEAMDRAERQKLYRKAQDKCRETVRKASTMLTLKLPQGTSVPIRIVPRGEERFVNFVDSA